MRFTPKDYQLNAVSCLKRSVFDGNKRICLKAPTGVGKTFIAAMIIEGALEKGNRVAFVAPYSVLINQTVDRFMEQDLPLPGVMQGQHELTDASRPIQICTAQTLGRRQKPLVDIVIVDEAHLQYKCVIEWMDKNPDIIFIGLTATPFAKGMGRNYQDLIEIKSLAECFDDGTLSGYEVYGVENPDLSGVKTVAGEYHEGQLAEIMGDAKLIGNIVDNWLKNGEARQTIVFSVNVLHANQVANDFDRAGIRSEVIVASTPLEERQEMFKRFERRETRILVSVGCLIAGFDAYVDCIIWAAPTKSDIKFLQGIGRGLRTAKGKDYCLIFDHSGTFTDKGFIEDVDACFDGLDDGEKKESSSAELEKEVKIKAPKECKKCTFLKPAGIHECPKCGFAPRYGEDTEVDETRGLKKLGKSKAKAHTKEDKQRFYSELLGYRKQAAKKYSDGWVAHKYRAKFGVWPKSMNGSVLEPTPTTLNWIKSQNIAWAKSRKSA